MGALLPSGRKAVVLVLWHILGKNSFGTTLGGATTYNRINGDLPGWVTSASSSYFPGQAAQMKQISINTGSGVTQKGEVQLIIADFRESPHPSNANSGTRNLGLSTGSNGVAGSVAGILGVLLGGAPQS